MHTLARASQAAAVAIAALTGLVIGSHSASAQSFNIDLDNPTSPPPLGGVPSGTFGAAAGQPGVWNSIFVGAGPFTLAGLDGLATSATLAIPLPPGMLSFNNPNNTGDFALLFNDAHEISGTSTYTYAFSGLADGQYSIYTYGTPPPPGTPGELFVTVPGSTEGTLMTSGAMIGNTFTLGVTHVVHTLNLVGGAFNINMVGTPGVPAYVNGFQIVAIPGPATLAVMLLSVAGTRGRRRRCSA